MSTKTFFLAWESHSDDHQWFPIGRLDADVEQPEYRFRYTKGSIHAKKQAGLTPLLNFPDFTRDYRSTRLFSMFQNRIMRPVRPDFPQYLHQLGLQGGSHPIDILAANGGRRVTDSFEVFPKLVNDGDGRYKCRFFIHGARYMNDEAQRRIERLRDSETLTVATELNNSLNEPAIQIQTSDRHIIGYAPRYLAEDLAATSASTDVKVRVVRVNPVPAPWSRRVLVEMVGHWDGHEPMSGPDYQPLVD